MTERAQLAVAIAADTTAGALAMAAASAAAGATLIEFRLDLMAEVDLVRLLAASPLPAIITCRPTRQGGRFAGSEGERLALLRKAADLGAPFVDVEADTLPFLRKHPHPCTRFIGSQHDFDGMLADWDGRGRQLAADGADVIKLVGMAASTEDVLRPLAWLSGLARPGIGIAMGAHGLASRLLAPRFASSLLSFAALGSGTAPGQIDVFDMVQSFGYHAVARADPLLVMLTPPAIPWEMVRECRQALVDDRSAAAAPWLLPIPTPSLGPALLQACRLSRCDGVLCLDAVRRDETVVQEGWDPDRSTWGRIPQRLASVVSPHYSV